MSKKIETPIVENIISEPLDDIMGDRYGIYAKYVIQDRAIPDARDGLKPVQRRIIFSMWNNNNVSKYKTRKCAKIVGDVIGKYHPHGDTSVYEALTRMSQDWKVRMPLITFQGNNGSIDGDQAAAYRYTEAKLSELADELVRDLDKKCVDMELTYDDTEHEPTVLPARFPNLFVNGAEGIAVAMATEIPPHNLKEIIDAVIHRIKHVRIEPIDLLQFIKGPDFPTGGIITDSEGLKNIYLTGRGRIEVASKAEIIEEKDCNKIVITEIPYKTVKIDIVHEIDQIRHNKTIDGILEVRDESDRHGLKIVIDCKKGININAIYKFLMTKTKLVSSYSANIVAIINGHPKTLNILDYVDCYIAHQVDVVTRISQFDLDKSERRLNIVNGLIKAINSLDETISIIRKSENKADAKFKLEDRFNLNEEQSEAIVMMPLYKLSHTDVNLILNEKKSLEAKILELKDILNNKESLNKVIIQDLRMIARKYGNDRRSEIKSISNEDKSFDKRDLIAKEDVMVSLTRDGYIKRSSIKSFKTSDCGIPSIKEGDSLVYCNKANTEDYLLAITSLGNFFVIPVYEIFENRWKEEGKQISYKINYNASNDKIVKAFTLKKFRDDLLICIVSKNGLIKRTLLSNFKLDRFTRAFSCMKLMSDDRVVGVTLTTGNNNLLVISNNGEAIYYNENGITSTGIKSGGMKAIKIKNDAKVASLISFKSDEKKKILIVTNKGHTRIFDNQHIELSNRLAKTTLIMPSFKNDVHKIIGVTVLNKDEEYTLIVNTSLKGKVEFKINDFYYTPIEKYAKTNLDITKKDSILSVYHSGYPINPNLISEYVPEPITNENEEKKNTDNFTQMSLFDEDNENK